MPVSRCEVVIGAAVPSRSTLSSCELLRFTLNILQTCVKRMWLVTAEDSNTSVWSCIMRSHERVFRGADFTEYRIGHL